MRKILAAMLVFVATASVASASIAVTEFVSNAEGEDSGREWIELFNYSAQPVDMTGWKLVDEGSDEYTFGSITIPSGGYIVLANGSTDMTEAQAKTVFEQEWFGGVADARVIGVTGIAMGNGGDEVIIKDAGDATVWNLAYDNDENDHSTWLTGDDFTRTDWGSDASEIYINRTGDDLGITGLLGYERNEDTLDALAWTSSFEGIKDAGFLTGVGLATDFYENVDGGSTGSPLTGAYTAAPEPATFVFLALGSLAILRRRS